MNEENTLFDMPIPNRPGIKLKPIKGFSKYGFCEKDKSVYNVTTERKIKVANKRCPYWMIMGDDGKRYALSCNRLLFAISKDIGYFDIPKSLSIVEKDGQLGVIYANQQGGCQRTEKAEVRKARAVATVNRHIKECEMLKRFYDSDDITEIYLYAMTLKYALCKKFVARYNSSAKRAVETFGRTVDVYIDNLRNGSSFVTNISNNILLGMNKIRKNDYKESQRIKPWIL